MLLEPRVEGPRRLKAAILLKNIGRKPAMQVLRRLLIPKTITIDRQRRVTIESISAVHSHTTRVEDIDLFFVIELQNISSRSAPVFPGDELERGDLEVSLDSDLPEQATMEILAEIYTEEAASEELLVVEVSRNIEARRQLSLEVRGYLGNILLEQTNWNPEDP